MNISLKVKRPTSWYLFLTGVFIWLPGISMLNIGGKGFQPLYLINILGLFLALAITPPTRHHRSITQFSALVFLSLSCSFLTSINSQSTFVFLHGLFCIASTIVFYTFLSKHGIQPFFSGYTIGGTISAIFGIIQFTFPSIAPYFLNNSSFGLVYRGLARAYGFTPEPSIFATLMIPLIGALAYRMVYLLGSKKPTKLDLLTLATLSISFAMTGSMSLLVVIPLYFIAIVMLDPHIKAKVFSLSRKIKRSFIRNITLMFILLIPLGMFAGTLLQSRFESTDATGSFNIRYLTIYLALSGFLSSPITGLGLGSAGSLMANNPTFLSELHIDKQGVDSWLVRTLCEQGLLGIIPIALILYAAKRRVLSPVPSDVTNQLRRESFILCIGSIICAILITGYRDLFNVWVMCAILCWLSNNPRQHQASSTEIRKI